MSFPAYVHGMLKMEAFAGAIRPDEQKAQVVVRVPSERKPDQSRLEVALFSHAGWCPGRRPALSGRLPLRLHRANPESISADRDHAEDPDQPGHRPESHSREAHQPERAAAWRRARTSRALQGLRAQPGLRPGRSRQDVHCRHPAAFRHAALRRRVGVVLRLRRIRIAAHDGPRRPRPANRPSE